MGEFVDQADLLGLSDDFQRHRNLWAEVMRVAIADAQMKGKNFSGMRKDAINWIFDDGRALEMNSFVSICRMLDIPPERIRSRIRQILGMRAA